MGRGVLRNKKQARKLALNICHGLIKNNMLLLVSTMDENIDRMGQNMLIEEINKINAGIKRRADAIDAEWEETDD